MSICSMAAGEFLGRVRATLILIVVTFFWDGPQLAYAQDCFINGGAAECRGPEATPWECGSNYPDMLVSSAPCRYYDNGQGIGPGDVIKTCSIDEAWAFADAYAPVKYPPGTVGDTVLCYGPYRSNRIEILPRAQDMGLDVNMRFRQDVTYAFFNWGSGMCTPALRPGRAESSCVRYVYCPSGYSHHYDNGVESCIRYKPEACPVAILFSARADKRHRLSLI